MAILITASLSSKMNKCTSDKPPLPSTPLPSFTPLPLQVGSKTLREGRGLKPPSLLKPPIRLRITRPAMLGGTQPLFWPGLSTIKSVCVKASVSRRPATPSHKHGSCPPFDFHRPKAGDAPHEGLLMVERREFRCSGVFGVRMKVVLDESVSKHQMRLYMCQ